MDEPLEGQEVTLEPDEPPKSGVWVDTCDVLAEPTEFEVAQGLVMGQEIDPGDDESGSAIRSFVTSDRDSALAKARRLKQVMLDFGVPQVSIELMPGRPNSYGAFDALYCVDEMSHHTVSYYAPHRLTPVLALCKHGRSDLPGPLCNGYGGYDLTYRIITFGYANHPGEGGPLTIPAYSGGTYTIPKDSARRYAWGTEWEGGLRSTDWDRILRNPRNGKTMTMREFMGRSNAALREFHKIVHHSEHSTWTSRKIDRLGYSSRSGTAELLRYREVKDEDDMPNYRDWSDADKKALAQDVADAVLQRGLQVRNVKGDKIKVTVKQALGRAANAPVTTKNQTEKVLDEIEDVRKDIDALNSESPDPR